MTILGDMYKVQWKQRKDPLEQTITEHLVTGIVLDTTVSEWYLNPIDI